MDVVTRNNLFYEEVWFWKELGGDDLNVSNIILSPSSEEGAVYFLKQSDSLKEMYSLNVTSFYIEWNCIYFDLKIEWSRLKQQSSHLADVYY